MAKALGSVCSHHWEIESPAGPSSSGRCKLCGVTSEFPNYADVAKWEGNKFDFGAGPLNQREGETWRWN